MGLGNDTNLSRKRPVAPVIPPLVSGLDEVLHSAIDLELGEGTQAEVEAVLEGRILITFQAGERELSLARIAEAGFHYESAGRDEAGILGNKWALLGETGH